jgi:deazaflavin-dependent oxidoreductase (nitroreductase family)
MNMREMENKMRHGFTYLNRYFMVPMFRLGFGPWMGTPFGGYIMVLKVIGRKTGKVRYAPVNYAIDNGNVYCIAGFGTVSDWYRNLVVNPNVEVIMPSGTIRGTAEHVTDPDERLRILRRVLINAGFAGFFYGYDPRRVTDEQLRESTHDVPVLCIRPHGIGSGASDPGGYAWILTLVSTVLFLAWLARGKKR